MKPADAYFFDIDGTLLVTRDLVHWNALHGAMLEVYGVDTTIEGLPYHGKTDVAILRAALQRCGVSRQAFDSGLPSALAAVCREVEKNAAGISADVCPAIPDVLSRILEGKKLLGVASGNLEAVGWHKLAAAGLRPFFGCGSFGDHCEQRVAIFDNAVRLAQHRLGKDVKVCFIGDTPDDIRAARSVNASIIAVSTGVFSFQELARMEPDACCQSCRELLGPF
jgi:phosphoglycolate phosphatase-like HAD superfamily hydrolase